MAKLLMSITLEAIEDDNVELINKTKIALTKRMSTIVDAHEGSVLLKRDDVANDLLLEHTPDFNLDQSRTPIR